MSKVTQKDLKELYDSIPSERPLSAHAVLDEVLAILMQDYKTLSKNNMDHKASGVHRAINLIKQYRRKDFI